MNKIKIQIVEDDIITATSLKETLEKRGHIITFISRTHGEAIESIEKQMPDLLLIDIRLKNSKTDGIEIAQEVSKNYQIPFVYLTANAEELTFERAKLTKPAAYLLKPFRNSELVYQVELAYFHHLANKNENLSPIISDSIFLPIEKSHQKIIKSEVLFIKAEGAYVKIYVKNEKQPFLFSMNIGYISQYFPTTNFYQISRSYIININFLRKFDSENILLYYYDEKIPLPQNKRPELLRQLAVIKTPNK